MLNINSNFLKIVYICVLRLKKQLKKQKGLILRVSSLSSAFTRLLFRTTTYRKVYTLNYNFIETILFSSANYLCCFFATAVEALNAMGVLSKSPVSSEDRLLLSESAASCLLCLAAQIALEVESITPLVTRSNHEIRSNRKFITFPSAVVLL